jgi:hypothetical protein
MAALAAAAAAPVAPSTAEMARLLEERTAMVNPAMLQFVVNDRRADLIAQRLKSRTLTEGERMPLRFEYASELVSAGRTTEALAALDALEADMKALSPEAWVAHRGKVGVLRGIANLRRAEEDNCHQLNNRESCLLPIRGGGVHRKREGSTAAVRALESVLKVEPDNLQARWLLNVASMTLGDYPARVAPRHLIPPKAFASEYPLPRFDNVAADVGLDVYGLSGGAVLDDFDNDGLLDLVLSSIGFTDQMRFFRNDGDGRFTDRTVEAGLTGEVGGLNLVQADYDNDGHLDVLVLRGGWMNTEGHFPFSLLRNAGGGRFVDVTRAAGLLRYAPSQTAAWLDYDGDGWLDLFVGNESAPEGSDWRYVTRSQLYHSNRDGTFTEVSHAVGIDVVAYVKGVVSGDYNNDGRPDLYVSGMNGDNRLFRNDGPRPGGGWAFTDVAGEAGVRAPKDSFGTFFFDYDNDAWPDLFVVGYPWTTAAHVVADYLALPVEIERGKLYRNRRDGTFADVTREAGLHKVIPAMGLNYGDLDNDGFLDMYLGTGNPDLSTLVPNRMFRNDGGRRFQDVTVAGNFGHLQKGHAVCFGDVDNDGDQDVFEEMGGAFLADKAYSALYRNPGNGHRWLSLELQGVRSNRSAIGARVKVVVEGKSGSREIHRTVGSGGSFGGSPLRQEIGLGDATRIVSVEVAWPATGAVQRLSGIEPDRRYQVREGEQTAVSVARPRFRLAPDAKEPARADRAPLVTGSEGSR